MPAKKVKYSAPVFRLLAALTAVAALLGGVGTAHAQHEHRVRPGQTLGGIARRYHVTVQTLAAANHLGTSASVQTGQLLVIPTDGTIAVRRGETLASVARAHHVEEADLAHANHLHAGAPLRAGQLLVLPGTAADASPAPHWGRPRNPGVVTFYRPEDHRTLRVRVLDRRGLVRRAAITDLARLMHPRGSRQTVNPHPRLVKLLARVSDHFGGRALEIVSGYRFARGFTRPESRHTRGEALDFRIRDVPVPDLRDFCRSFDHVGVGYYPTTHFVHLDVRRDSAQWTDVSGGGEAPRYVHSGESIEQAMADRRTAEVSPEARDDAPDSADDGAAPVSDDTQVSND